MKLDLPYLARERGRTGWRYSVRKQGAGGGRIALREPPGSPAFMAEYAEALARLDDRAPPKRREATGTLRWLVAEFEASHRFRKVTPREQRNRHLLVRSILDEETKPGSGVRLGDCPLSRFEPAHVRLIRDRKMATPSAANHRLANLRVIFAWGLEERSAFVKRNPCVGVAALDHKAEGWHTWTEAEIEAYEARHPTGTQGRLALDLLLYTGARRGDVVTLGPKSLLRIVNPVTRQPETWIEFQPGKTRHSTAKVLTLPVLPVLAASIAATPHGLQSFLINAYGKPHASGDSFANWFKDRVLEAELPPHCSPHGLRKAGACRAADNGATEKQMMAIYGWTTGRLAAHYAAKANDKRLAASAMHMLGKS